MPGGRAGACTNERGTSDAARAHGYVGRRAAGRRGGSKATAREEAGSRLSEPAADSKMRRPQPTGDVGSEGSPVAGRLRLPSPVPGGEPRPLLPDGLAFLSCSWTGGAQTARCP